MASHETPMESEKPTFPTTERTVTGTSDAVYVEPELTWRTWAAVLCASLSTFSQLLSVTGAAGVISFIIQDIPKGRENATWIISGITLVQASACPLVARLSDLTGQRKWIMAVSSLFGVAGAAVACRANDINQVVAGQILIGFACTVVGINSSIPSEVLPHRYRGYAQATVLFAANAASLIGSVATGAMVRKPGGWRIIFYLLIAVYALVFFGFVFVYNPPVPADYKPRSFGELLHAIDLVGSLLLAAGLSLSILGLTWGGGAYPWKSAHTLAPLIVGVALLGVFGIWEWKGRKDGILDHRIFKLSRNFGIATAALSIEGFVYFAAVAAYLPQMIRALGYASDPILIGCRAFIFTACAFCATFPYSYYATKRKDMRSPLVLGFVLFLVAIIMFSQANPGKGGDNLTMGATAIAGLGFAAPLVFLIAVVQLCAPPELIATVTAVVASARAMGGCVGTAVVTAIKKSKLDQKLPELVVPAAVGAGLPESSVGPVLGLLGINPALIATVPGVTPGVVAAVMPAYQQAQAYSYHYLWYTIIPFVALSVVACACLESVADKMNYKVDRPYEDVHNIQRRGGVEAGLPEVAGAHSDSKADEAEMLE